MSNPMPDPLPLRVAKLGVKAQRQRQSRDDVFDELLRHPAGDEDAVSMLDGHCIVDRCGRDEE